MKVKKLSTHSTKKGCPNCGGVDPKSCMRCFGKTKMKHWYHMEGSWRYLDGVDQIEITTSETS